VRTYRNLILTMVLGGLWHGASWTFVVWGALHGVALAVTRMWQRSRPAPSHSTGAGAWIATALTFHFVCFAWIFFRAPTLPHAALVLAQIARGSWTMDHIAPKVVLVLAGAAALHLFPRSAETIVRDAFVRTSPVLRGLVLAAAAVLLHIVAAAKPEPFVYGQF